jgi:hypothetical protein
MDDVEDAVTVAMEIGKRAADRSCQLPAAQRDQATEKGKEKGFHPML